MKVAQRRGQIQAALLAGRVTVASLASQHGVVESTIRRDLAVLEGQGLIERTYGGAFAGLGYEPDVTERERLARNEKIAIALEAASLVSDGDTVILDSGTTCTALARHLRARRGLTVITSGFPVAECLTSADDVEVILLGGSLRRQSRGTVGPVAESALRGMTARVAFLGADGVVAERGICEASPSQVALKTLMVAQVREVVVLADSSKLGRSPSHFWMPLESPWTLITDSGADAEQVDRFESGGCEVIRADAGVPGANAALRSVKN